MSRELVMIQKFLLNRKIKLAGCNHTLLHRRAEADLAMKAIIRTPKGATIERCEAAGLPALWVWAEDVPEGSNRTLLYFHGGGFYSGSSETHKGLAAAISEASGIRVLLIDYRLAPEHLFPAAHDDALATYRWLLHSGVAPHDIVIGGDSAGGTLTLATLLALRDAGEPLPAAAILLSPWLDTVDFNGESFVSRAELDPMVDIDCTLRDALVYFGENPDKNAIGLLHRDMDGLPPLLIQVGDHEILLSESMLLAEKAKAARVDVTLEVWPELWHVFQALTAILPEAREAVEKIGEFIKLKFQNEATGSL
jgi:epsilon-lactone hydrolase